MPQSTGWLEKLTHSLQHHELVCHHFYPLLWLAFQRHLTWAATQLFQHVHYLAIYSITKIHLHNYRYFTHGVDTYRQRSAVGWPCQFPDQTQPCFPAAWQYTKTKKKSVASSTPMIFLSLSITIVLFTWTTWVCPPCAAAWIGFAPSLLATVSLHLHFSTRNLSASSCPCWAAWYTGVVPRITSKIFKAEVYQIIDFYTICCW